MLVVDGHSNHDLDLYLDSESHSSWNLLHESLQFGTMNLFPRIPFHKGFLEWVGGVKNKVEDELRRVIYAALECKERNVSHRSQIR